MSDQTALLEAVLANTRQQLASAMATNAELAAVLQQTQEKLTSMESTDSSGDTKEVSP
jgi:hypothetical protein